MRKFTICLPAIALAAVAIIPTPGSANASEPPARAGASAAPPGLLWDGDASKGTGIFDGLERAPGSITVADEGQYGPSFRYETWDHSDGKERCESRGTKGLLLDASRLDQTYYVGWRSKLNPMPITSGRWIAFWQLHWSGAGPGGGPMTIRTLGDGKFHLEYVKPSGGGGNIWSAPISLNTWNSFVVAFRLSRDSSGYIEFWYNGVQQKFNNGSTRYTGAIFKGHHVNNKWGVYRSGPNKGRAVNWVNHPRIGTTYESVAPQ